MKIIKGIEIDEIEDLNYNLDKLRTELKNKLSFWGIYEKTIRNYKKKGGRERIGITFKIALFIMLFPEYLTYVFYPGRRESTIREAEMELIEYYELPETKIKRFRLQCKYERSCYEEALKIIDEELKVQRKNLESASIGEQIRGAIHNLIKEYEEKRKKKQNKYAFYKKCEEKLFALEEQIKIKKSIEISKQKLAEMREAKSARERQKEIGEELELYKYYGTLLEDLSMNLKKVELDKEEQLEELELKEMLSKIKIN